MKRGNLSPHLSSKGRKKGRKTGLLCLCYSLLYEFSVAQYIIGWTYRSVQRIGGKTFPVQEIAVIIIRFTLVGGKLETGFFDL